MQLLLKLASKLPKNKIKVNDKMISLQKKVQDFCNQFHISAPLTYRLLDLISELGETSKEILKLTNYGKQPEFTLTNELEMELGDVLFSLICLCNDLKIDLEQSLLKVIDKYETRIRRKNSPDSSDE